MKLKYALEDLTSTLNQLPNYADQQLQSKHQKYRDMATQLQTTLREMENTAPGYHDPQKAAHGLKTFYGRQEWAERQISNLNSRISSLVESTSDLDISMGSQAPTPPRQTAAAEQVGNEIMEMMYHAGETYVSTLNLLASTQLNQAAFHAEIVRREIQQNSNSQTLDTILARYQAKDNNLPTAATALRRAAFKGKLEDVAILALFVDDIDCTGSNAPQTALYWSCHKTHPLVAAYLLAKGANPDAEQGKKTTPRELVAAIGNPKEAGMYRRDDAAIENDLYYVLEESLNLRSSSAPRP